MKEGRVFVTGGHRVVQAAAKAVHLRWGHWSGGEVGGGLEVVHMHQMRSSLSRIRFVSSDSPSLSDFLPALENPTTFESPPCLNTAVTRESRGRPKPGATRRGKENPILRTGNGSLDPEPGNSLFLVQKNPIRICS